MNKNITLMVLVALSLLISGCSGLLSSEQPAKQVYLLKPLSLSASGAEATEHIALEFNLQAVPGLDTDRIQALDSDARLRQYANARWPDFLPEVLSSVVRRSLLSSNRFNQVQSGKSSGSDNWQLQLEIQQFYGIQSSTGSTSAVSAELAGSISCNGESHRFRLSSSQTVTEERLAIVVGAHQRALDDLTQQLWTSLESHCD